MAMVAVRFNQIRVGSVKAIAEYSQHVDSPVSPVV